MGDQWVTKGRTFLQAVVRVFSDVLVAFFILIFATSGRYKNMEKPLNIREGSDYSSGNLLKTLTRLYGCTDWFESSLYAHANLYPGSYLGSIFELSSISLIEESLIYLSLFFY